MLRKVFTYSMVLVGLAISAPYANASQNQTFIAQSEHSEGDLPDEVVTSVLQATAQELGISFSVLVGQYADGTCTITEIGPQLYQVRAGGTILQVVLDGL